MGLMVSDEEQKLRIAICRECPHFNHVSNRCKKCGCFMKIKTRLIIAKCPLNYWDRTDSGNTLVQVANTLFGIE